MLSASRGSWVVGLSMPRKLTRDILLERRDLETGDGFSSGVSVGFPS